MSAQSVPPPPPRARADPPPSPPQIVAAFLQRCPAARVECMRFPLEPPEYFACRVLRARKFSLDAALELVAETAAWRAEQKLDELVARDPSEVLGCLEDELHFFYKKSYFPTRDKEGRPIYVENGGAVDVDAMFSEMTGGEGVGLRGQLRSGVEKTTFLQWPAEARVLTPWTPPPPSPFPLQRSRTLSTSWRTTSTRTRRRWCPCLAAPRRRRAAP